ncbi:hypothetical protein [Neobacillus drentensis]|uniref:hypothetical protein n=1 Tax=Neobacillus drentensis TaxID=220684 RepID=UPI002FFD9C09
MFIVPFTTALIAPVATFYCMIKAIDYMYSEMSGKEKPITAINFKQWKDGWE